jgi:hypothetical protein
MGFDISKDIETLIFGAILGPPVGLIGTKVKSLAEKRDAKQAAKQLVKEAGDLLGFADTLHKSVAAGGLAAKIPAESLESLESSVVNKVEAAIAAVCPACIAVRRNPTKTVLDKVLLMHKPFVWWAWIVHGLYYMLVGMCLIVIAVAISDYRTPIANRTGTASPGDDLALLIVLAIPTVVVNVIGNVIARRHYERAQSAAPAVCAIHNDVAAAGR